MFIMKAVKATFIAAFLLGSVAGFAQQMTRNRLNQNDTEVRFFSRDNYRGDQKRQGEGDSRSVNWLINSIQVPSGYVVEAYAQENFRGQSTRYVGNVTRISTPIRSLRITRETSTKRPDFSNDRGRNRDQRPGSNGREVLLYADINYGGGSLALSEGRYRGSALRNLTRQVSSINIPVGYKVQVYDTDNFTGNSYTFTTSANDLRTVSWNDRAASIIISRGR